MIFDFNDVTSTIAIVEGAISRTQLESQIEGRNSAIAAASDPGHDFRKNPIFAPMMLAMWKAEVTFPMIVRRSLLIAIYSHIEHLLRRWCDGLHNEWSLPQDFKLFSKKRSGSTPELCLQYVRDVGGLPIGSFQGWAEWDAIDGYRLARNCLAHDGGIVDDAAQRVKIERLAHVQVDDSGLVSDHPTIVLLPGACEAAAEVAKRFLDRLVEAYRLDPRAARTT